MYIHKTRSLNIFTVCLLGLMAIPGVSSAQDFDVVLMLGQSNMDGRGEVGNLDSIPQTDAIIWYTNPTYEGSVGCETDGFVPMEPGFSIPPRTDAVRGCVGEEFGPEVGFAEFIDENSNRQLAVIKFSEGGTNLRTDWDPTENNLLYDQSLTTFDRAMDALDDMGINGTLRAIVWHQGESDAGNARNGGDYGGRLEELIEAYRNDLNDDDLPFIIGEVFDNGRRDEIREFQEEVADTVDNVAFSVNNGLDAPDDTHFDAPGQIRMGNRMGRHYLRMTD